MKKRILYLCGLMLAALGIFAAAPETSKHTDSVVEAARHNNLGVAYMNQQSFDKALKEFEQAATLDPKLRIAKLNQGVALLGLAKLEQATSVLQEAAKQAPDDPHAWFNLGLVYKSSSNLAAAIDAFKHVVAVDSGDANTWYFLGAVYAQNKQFTEAIDAFQHALKIDPHHASAEFGLARAYQQSGDPARAREHLVTFQHITQSKLGAAMGLAYGDQGKYSLAEESPSAMEKALPEIPVKFVDVTKEAGLTSKPILEQVNNPDQGFIQQFGPGACFLDYDGDGRMDIFIADNGPQGGFALYHNLGNGKFEDTTKKAGFDPTSRGIGCTAGDYDNDGEVDLAVSFYGHVALFHNEKNGTFKDVTEAAGIHSVGPNVGLSFIDYDHDGDLDLYVTRSLNTGSQSFDGTSSWNAMWRNNGNGTFADVTNSVGLSGLSSVSAIGTDYNNDRAIDLVVTQFPFQLPAMFENPREGKFIDRAPWPKGMPMSNLGIAILDFDHDGWMDLAFTHEQSPAVTLWRNNQGKSFEQVPLPETNWAKAYGVAAIDYDNDGLVDLVAVGETKDGNGEVRLFRNLGPDGFKDVTADVGLDKIQLKEPRAIITGDFDNDGATDLLITQNHAPAVLLRNEGGNKNNWLKLDLKGLADNKSAIGTKVEIFSGMNRQKFEIYGSNGFLGQNSTVLNIGLGRAKEADVVRMLWPSGVVQDEIEVAANKTQSFTEMDRRGSSCPTLFVWDGNHYELVADMIGAGVVGHWVGPNERNIARPTEYIKIDRDLIQEKDESHPSQNQGRMGHPTFSFRLMEPMEEVVYLDQVKMLAVDHPADFDVYPNEYFASNPPYPDFKVVASSKTEAQPPAGAWDEHGHNLLPDLLAHRYVGDFKLEPFKGFTKPHTLELDLGSAYQGGPLWLLMHGEIEYFTATGMYAASQAGIEATAPYVEALNSKGVWVKVINDMGFPAGGPRTMTADLTGKLPQGTRRIRITTNLQIYWDNILIDRTPQNQPVRLSEIPLQSANLDFHGYPRQTEAHPPGVVKYNYEQVSATGPYARAAGAYTRYGDVRPLLAHFDDRLAVFGSGEEVQLEFDPAKLPSLPKGWTRDYFFLANGYEKDMDFYAADGSTVAPLPFRAMGTYPYAGKSYPLDQTHMNDLLNYNTRDLSGNEPKGYAFHYRDRP
jgi:tetratricopeptide (TPR) repeat protein